MHIGIVGLGLIGGSLGLDLRCLGYRVWGMSRRENTCQQALARGAIDTYYHLGSPLPADTDILVLCTPLDRIIPTLVELVPYLPADTIVTDVGSVKAPIVKAAMSLWSGFVGSHPMAGNNNTGIGAAQGGLFRGRPCAVIAEAGNELGELVADLWRRVGMTIYFCGEEEHDRAVAWISHLPVMVSAALNLACDREANWAVKVLGEKLASSGFADTSRVGGGNPELGRLMAQLNREALLLALDHYQASLQSIRQAIETNAWAELDSLLSHAQVCRQRYLPPSQTTVQ